MNPRWLWEERGHIEVVVTVAGVPRLCIYSVLPSDRRFGGNVAAEVRLRYLAVVLRWATILGALRMLAARYVETSPSIIITLHAHDHATPQIVAMREQITRPQA